MAKYSRTEIIDAHQIAFSDQDKDAAAKGAPVASHGSTIRHDSVGNLFSVLIHKLGRHAQEGDWVVTEASGKQLILSDVQFKKDYHEVPETADETPVGSDLSSEPKMADAPPAVPSVPEAPAIPPSTPPATAVDPEAPKQPETPAA